MGFKNIAYTTEYRNRNEAFDYLFEDTFLVETHEHVFADGRWRVVCVDYFDEFAPLALGVQCLKVYDQENQLIFEQKCYYDARSPVYILHANGMEYMLFWLDLYGYSILNLTTLTAYHYVPEAVLTGDETFIWTDVVYSGTDKIAVEGCYWACNHEFEIYDFSEPENLPYKLLVKHEDLEARYDNWLEPVGWLTPNEYAYKEHVSKNKNGIKILEKFITF